MRSNFPNQPAPTAALRWALLAAVPLIGSCKDSSEPGGTPTSIEIVAAAPVSGVAGTTVSPSPSFVVKNASGQPIKADLVVSVSSGGGRTVGAPVKSAAGATSVGTWKLGYAVGSNVLSVTVAGLAPITYTVTGTAGPARKIVETNPRVRAGSANAILASTIIVAVLDTFGNPLSGQTVNFSIAAGAGSLTGGATATTDANGQATAPSWRLGKSASAQTLRVTSGTANAFDINATVQSSYNIVVRFFDATSMTPAQQTLFTNAAQRIMGVVTGDMADVQFTNIDVSSCLGQAAATTVLNETVDDVVVYASIKPIDGPGLILAQAGFCYFRAGAGCTAGCDKVPLLGVMSFDSADLNTLSGGGSLQEVITHEMLHILGVGTLWPSFYLNFLTGAGTSDPRYTGAQGISGCKATGGIVSCASTVPVENTGGAGTRDSHWRESTFGSELMTGFINASPNAFSSLTIGALQDIGYVVNAGDNDFYTISAGSIMAGGFLAPAQMPLPANWEGPSRVDVYSIDRGGNIRLVRKAQ